MAEDSAERTPMDGSLLDQIGERSRRFSTGILGGEQAMLDNLLTYRANAAFAGTSGVSESSSGVVSRTTDFSSSLQSLLSHNEAQRTALRVQAEQPASRFAPLPGRQVQREAVETAAPEAATAEDAPEPEAPKSPTSWITDLEKKFAVAKERVSEYLDRQIPSGPSAAQLESVLGSPRSDGPPAGGDANTVRRRSRIQEAPTGVRIEPPPAGPQPPASAGPPSSEGVSQAGPDETEPGEQAPPVARTQEPIQRTPAPAADPGPSIARPIRQRRRGATPPPVTEPSAVSDPIAQRSTEPEAIAEASAGDDEQELAPPVPRRVVAATAQPAPAPAPTIGPLPGGVRETPSRVVTPVQRSVAAAPVATPLVAAPSAPATETPAAAPDDLDEPGEPQGGLPATPPPAEPPGGAPRESTPASPSEPASSTEVSRTPADPGPGAGGEASARADSSESASDVLRAVDTAPAGSPAVPVAPPTTSGAATGGMEVLPERPQVLAEQSDPAPAIPSEMPLARRTNVPQDTPAATSPGEPSATEQTTAATAPSDVSGPPAGGAPAVAPSTPTSDPSRSEPPAPRTGAQADNQRDIEAAPAASEPIARTAETSNPASAEHMEPPSVTSTPASAEAAVNRSVEAQPPPPPTDAPAMPLAQAPGAAAPSDGVQRSSDSPGDAQGAPAVTAAAGTAPASDEITDSPQPVQRSVAGVPDTRATAENRPTVAAPDGPAGDVQRPPSPTPTANAGQDATIARRAETGGDAGSGSLPERSADAENQSAPESAITPPESRPTVAAETPAAVPGEPQLVLRTPDRAESAGPEPEADAPIPADSESGSPGADAPASSPAGGEPTTVRRAVDIGQSQAPSSGAVPPGQPGAPSRVAEPAPGRDVAPSAVQRESAVAGQDPSGTVAAAGAPNAATPVQPAESSSPTAATSNPSPDVTGASEARSPGAVQRVAAEAPDSVREEVDMPLLETHPVTPTADEAAVLASDSDAASPAEAERRGGDSTTAEPQVQRTAGSPATTEASQTHASGPSPTSEPVHAPATPAPTPAADTVRRSTGGAPQARGSSSAAAPQPPAAESLASVESTVRRRVTVDTGSTPAQPHAEELPLVGQPPVADRTDVAEQASTSGSEQPGALAASETSVSPTRVATGTPLTTPVSRFAAAPSSPLAAAPLPRPSRPQAVQRSVEAAPAATSTAAVAEPASGAEPASLPTVLAQPLQRMPAPPPSMPLAQPAVVQRAETSTENSMTIDPGGDGEGGSKEPNIDELSEKVWRKLEHRMRVERERQFGLP